MKRGTSISNEYDGRGQSMVRIVKRRGKLTLDEICDVLRFDGHQQWNGHYAIILNCSEATLGGNGLYLDENSGDAVDLLRLDDFDECPVCGKMLPPFEYCPSCGKGWNESEKEVESILAKLKKEAEYNIKCGSATDENRAAHFNQYLGTLELALRLGLIQESKNEELRDEIAKLLQTRD